MGWRSATPLAKRRQGDHSAVTQVKLWSLVKSKTEGRQSLVFLEGNSRWPLSARPLETSAGSEGAAGWEKEVPRNLGGPARSWGENSEYDNRQGD